MCSFTEVGRIGNSTLFVNNSGEQTYLAPRAPVESGRPQPARHAEHKLILHRLQELAGTGMCLTVTNPAAFVQTCVVPSCLDPRKYRRVLAFPRPEEFLGAWEQAKTDGKTRGLNPAEIERLDEAITSLCKKKLTEV